MNDMRFSHIKGAERIVSRKYSQYVNNLQEAEKQRLAATTGLSLLQLNNWFINRRKRLNWKAHAGVLQATRSSVVYTL